VKINSARSSEMEAYFCLEIYLERDRNREAWVAFCCVFIDFAYACRALDNRAAACCAWSRNAVGSK